MAFLIVVTALFVCLAGLASAEEASSGASPRALRGNSAEVQGAQKRASQIRTALEVSFKALPKNHEDRLDFRASLYILHRIFGQLNGWVIRGLELGENSSVETGKNSSSKMDLSLQDHLSSIGTHSRGYDLDGLVKLALAIDNIAQQQASSTLTTIYKELNFSVDIKLSREQMEKVMETYMIVYLGGSTWSVNQAVKFRKRWEDRTPYWPSNVAWLRSLEQQHVNDTTRSLDFGQLLAIALEIGSQYSSFNQDQCTELKLALGNSWALGSSTGRARLVDFYKLGLSGGLWTLDEQDTYLEAIGALDVSNRSAPMVVIPNYLLAEPNCLHASKLYSVCCKNECEELMASLESSIAAPTAPTERILEHVSQLKTDTVEAPRKMSPKLVQRLEEIGKLHGGEVVLHGRLFAQWLHHAFPNECAYPHETGKASPLTPEGWMGVDPAASLEERQRHIEEDTCGPEAAAQEWSGDLPWSTNEELFSSPVQAAGLAHAVPKRRRASPLWFWLLVAMPVAAALLCPARAVKLLQRLGARSPQPLARCGVVVLASLFLLVVANKILAVMMIVGGLLFNRLLAKSSKPEDKLPAKCCV